MTESHGDGEGKGQQELTLEESFARLDGLLENMEREGIALEDSFRLYEQGMALVKDMRGRLNDLEGRVEKIAADGSTEEFEDEF